MSPNVIKITPLIHCQAVDGTSIRAVVALSKSVKTTTEIPSDVAIM
jgi:hypothetical protein